MGENARKACATVDTVDDELLVPPIGPVEGAMQISVRETSLGVVVSTYVAIPGLAEGRRCQSIDVAMRIFAPTERPQQIALVSCTFVQPSYSNGSHFVVTCLDALGDYLVEQRLICPELRRFISISRGIRR